MVAAGARVGPALKCLGSVRGGQADQAPDMPLRVWGRLWRPSGIIQTIIHNSHWAPAPSQTWYVRTPSSL